MYDFYPPISAYVIPLLLCSWPKRCFITVILIVSLVSFWYIVVYRHLVRHYQCQKMVIEKTNQDYSQLSEIKKQIACLEHGRTKQQKYHGVSDASTSLLSLCSSHNLIVDEYDNQSAALPGTITTRGQFDDQYALLQNLCNATVACTYCSCRVERVDDELVAMTLSFRA